MFVCQLYLNLKKKKGRYRPSIAVNNGFIDDTDLCIAEINAPTLNFSKSISGNSVIPYYIVLISCWCCKKKWYNLDYLKQHTLTVPEVRSPKSDSLG